MRVASMLLLTLCIGSMNACGHASSDTSTTMPVIAAANPGTTAEQTADAGGAAPPSSSDSAMDDNSGDPQLTPLSAADVQLYLTVMRAAAERVRHPTADDFAAQKRAQAWQTAIANAHGSVVAPTDADLAANDRVLMLNSGQTDILIVLERHLDEDRYSRIADDIEEALPTPGTAVLGCPRGDCTDASPVPAAQDRLYDAAVVRNRKLLAPYRTEINSLETVVRKLNSLRKLTPKH